MRYPYLCVAAVLSIAFSDLAHSYTHQASGVRVGFVRVAGNYGAAAFGRADGLAFAGCTNDSTTMWADTTYVTADGQKALLATLLTAKAMGTPITVYYTISGGYCQFQIVDLENTGASQAAAQRSQRCKHLAA